MPHPAGGVEAVVDSLQRCLRELAECRLRGVLHWRVALEAVDADEDANDAHAVLPVSCVADAGWLAECNLHAAYDS